MSAGPSPARMRRARAGSSRPTAARCSRGAFHQRAAHPCPGDCISLHGRPLRYIEPLIAQARVLAQRLMGDEDALLPPLQPVVRVKTTSMALTL